MTLRLKINLLVGCLTLLFVLAVMGLQLRSMRESVTEEVVAANRVAAQLLNRSVWRYAPQGTQAMLAFLQGVGRIRANDVVLYDEAGQEIYRSPPSPYKAGRDAPDWFERLVSPPPAVLSIEFPGGRLVVQSNASRAVVDAWDYTQMLTGSAVVLLVALNALVFWLVGRAVRPFGEIVRALDRLQAGRFDVALPPLAGSEAAAIGQAFNRMVGELQRHIDTERRAVRAELQLSDSRQLARWLDQHVEQERRMIARELHDELGQSVTAMRSMALSLAQRVRPFDADAEQTARLIADESSRLYDAMHGIIPRLTPLVLDSLGFAEALDELAERTRRSQPGVEIRMSVELGDVQLPSDMSLALYRAAQEGMTNALRHGRARRIEVTVRNDASDLHLDVLDDGVGLAAETPSGSAAPFPDTPSHYGLRWLRERVEGLGGRMSLESVMPHGARLRVHVPIPSIPPADTGRLEPEPHTEGTA